MLAILYRDSRFIKCIEYARNIYVVSCNIFLQYFCWQKITDWWWSTLLISRTRYHLLFLLHFCQSRSLTKFMPVNFELATYMLRYLILNIFTNLGSFEFDIPEAFLSQAWVLGILNFRLRLLLLNSWTFR